LAVVTEALQTQPTQAAGLAAVAGKLEHLLKQATLVQRGKVMRVVLALATAAAVVVELVL
jgi:hypothetical protein